MLVESVKEGVEINPLAARSIFWELDTEVTDPAFEKEAWISAVLLSAGDCGLTVGNEATVFFCPADYAPGAALGYLVDGHVDQAFDKHRRFFVLRARSDHAGRRYLPAIQGDDRAS